MKALIKILSLISLIATILPSILVFNNVISMETNKLIMTLGTLLWFSTAPFWMNKKV
ncbi:MAG: hypothetical protein IPK06_02750 [Ignavibacteriae bacterium]|jgi:hypothetical protein|nr:hypothetical protein [Ignavibacteriota bacterium]